MENLKCAATSVEYPNQTVCNCKYSTPSDPSYTDWCCNKANNKQCGPSVINGVVNVGGQNKICNSDGAYVCDRSRFQCLSSCPGATPAPAEIHEPGFIASMPLASAISLIFVAFFFGIILSYLIYKIRKSRNNGANAKYTPQETGESSQHALTESSRSAEDSQVGEKHLTMSPLSEQV